LHTCPITTIRQSFDELSRVAAKLMIERIENPHMPAREIRLMGDLIIRESCGMGIKGRTKSTISIA
ncbi:MAG: LacI family DNA-binding transcriptional regulator, partial [Planctomycetota bacterium]